RVATSSATVVHAMDEGREAVQSVELVAGHDSILQYLPQPLVLLPHSRLAHRLVLEAVGGATVLACDGFLMHDPHEAGRAFDVLDSTIEIRRPGGRLLALDRSRVRGSEILADLPGVSRGLRAFGTIVLAARAGRFEALGTLAAEAAAAAGCYAGTTALRED